MEVDGITDPQISVKGVGFDRKLGETIRTPWSGSETERSSYKGLIYI